MAQADRPRETTLPARSAAAYGLLAAMLLLVSCDGPQSALDTAGRDAERIETLWWSMAAGALAIWIAVVALAWYATRGSRRQHRERVASLLIVGCGAVFPTLVLAALLVIGLRMMPQMLALPADDDLMIEVSGEQWWWRVTYHVRGREPITLANEIRLPVGRRVAIELTSPDVIHSFWIPSLAGKMDMIPGRRTRIALEPTRTGTFRGACAEYCGASHALMNLYAVVEEEAAFEAWLDGQAAAAQQPSGTAAMRGRDVFAELGCGACHAVRGTPADGVVGPDLTHVGGRVSIAAGILPNDTAAFARFIAEPESVKPGVHMPPFGMIEPADLRALVIYLDGLR